MKALKGIPVKTQYLSMQNENTIHMFIPSSLVFYFGLLQNSHTNVVIIFVYLI